MSVICKVLVLTEVTVAGTCTQANQEHSAVWLTCPVWLAQTLSSTPSFHLSSSSIKSHLIQYEGRLIGAACVSLHRKFQIWWTDEKD